MPTIKEILQQFPEIKLQSGDIDFFLSGIHSDSRRTDQETVFVLLEDTKDLSSKYMQDALSRGCRVLLYPKEKVQNPNINDFQVVLYYECDLELGRIASYIYGNPSSRLRLTAVTGTNGKTSVTNILFQIFQSAGFRTGLIGTISVRWGNHELDTGYTTPDACTTQQILKRMVDDGVEHVFMEASSHGLKLGRMDEVELAGGIFTNLTMDHLDFHGSMDDYFNSKKKLFSLLDRSGLGKKQALIFVGDKYGEDIASCLLKKADRKYFLDVIGPNGNYHLLKYELRLDGSSFEVLDGDANQTVYFETNLLGHFNCINVCIAVIYSLRYGLESDFLCETIRSLDGVLGRFEVIRDSSQKKIAVIDYAHTPDALENILQSLKKIPSSKLISIFGCGGDRDKNKRPIMGEIACRYSDFTIMTSDNPRTENPDAIIQEIVKGVPDGFTNYKTITDREAAIQYGIDSLPDLGILLIAGKGHENYQILGREKRFFSDQETVKKIFGI